MLKNNPFPIPELGAKAELSVRREKVRRIFRIETDRYRPCEWRTIGKRRRLIAEQIFAVHVDKYGNIEWKELG